MHIVLVSAQHHPSHGGIGAYVWELIHAADAAGWNVELITRPSVMIDQLPVRTVHAVVTEDTAAAFKSRIGALRRIERIRPYRYGLWSLAVAKKLLELKVQPDAIEFVDCQAEGFVSLTSAAVRDRFGSSRFMISAHTPMCLHEQHSGIDLARFGRPIYHQWECTAIARADGLMAPSSLLLHRLEAHANSIALPPPMREVQACLPANNQAVVLIGAVQPQKGVHVWARSLNRVLLAKPRTTAVLIGPDTPTAPDGLSMAAHVQRLIDPRCIDRFRWLGALPHERVMQMVDDAALVVVPSAFESFSYAAAEVIMRGRPVVISDQVGLGEHVSGLLTVPCDDVDELAEAQIEVLNDLPAAHDRALESRATLLAACSPQRHIQRRAEFILSVTPMGCAADQGDQPDAIEHMAAFLHDVDQMIATSNGSPASEETETTAAAH